MTAVENFISSKVGDAKFKAIRPLLATAAMVEVFEAWLSDSLRTGGSRFSGNRSSERRETVSDAEWNQMSYSQKKDYASRFSGGR